MAVIKSKPTSPGRRFVQTVKTDNLHKGRPHRSLTSGLKKTGGRNNYGRMTTRHIGGGHKRLYREIDFKRNKDFHSIRKSKLLLKIGLNFLVIFFF